MPGVFMESDDVCIYVTEKCNSNCIMCPMSLASRKRGDDMPESQWADLKKIIPIHPPHITITGGEPFLDYKHVIPAIKMISANYPDTDVLILTNGRALSLDSIISEVSPFLTDHFCFAVPIHAPHALLHDEITQTVGSFQQTINGLRRLKNTLSKIEVRIVGHRLNIDQINETFRMLADSDLRITTINLLGMEMTGCAASNRTNLWVDYLEICKKASAGIRYAVHRGINVGLYNFPFCKVPRELWGIVRNSITPNKIRYYEDCKSCQLYDTCGGIFYSTYELNLLNVKPI